MIKFISYNSSEIIKCTLDLQIPKSHNNFYKKKETEVFCVKKKKIIPSYYQKIIDDKFLKDFKDELCLVFDIKNDEFNLSFVQVEENTNGWATAFAQACLLNNTNELYEYYDNLDWQESDNFCREITNMMNNRGIIE